MLVCENDMQKITEEMYTFLRACEEETVESMLPLEKYKGLSDLAAAEFFMVNDPEGFDCYLTLEKTSLFSSEPIHPKTVAKIVVDRLICMNSTYACALNEIIRKRIATFSDSEMERWYLFFVVDEYFFPKGDRPNKYTLDVFTILGHWSHRLEKIMEKFPQRVDFVHLFSYLGLHLQTRLRALHGDTSKE
jgi:hypothetical protein